MTGRASTPFFAALTIAAVAAACGPGGDGGAVTVADSASDSGPVDTSTTPDTSDQPDAADAGSIDTGTDAAADDDTSVRDADAGDPTRSVKATWRRMADLARRLQCRRLVECRHRSAISNLPAETVDECLQAPRIRASNEFLKTALSRSRAVEMGLQTFDTQQAQSCLQAFRDALRDSSPCTPAVSDLVEEACSTVTSPAQQKDEKCLRDIDCKDDLACNPEAASNQCWGKCVEPSPSGVDEKMKGESCLRSGQCADGLYCGGSSGEKTCIETIAEGEACQEDEACASGLTCAPDGAGSKSCQPPRAAEEPCDDDADCAEGWICEEVPGAGGSGSLCYEKFAAGQGEDCADDDMCERQFWCGSDNTCTSTPLAEGAECQRTDSTRCAAGLVCRPTQKRPGATFECLPPGESGDACSVTYFFGGCAIGHYCPVDRRLRGFASCQPLGTEGDTCTNKTLQRLPNCKDASYCSGSSGTCTSKKSVGEACESNRACEGGAGCYPDSSGRKVCGGIYGSCQVGGS